MMLAELEQKRIQCRDKIVMLEQRIREIDRKMIQMIGVQTKLTTRQTEVLERIKLLKHNKEIAEELFISVRTVKFHVSKLFEIFGVTSREQLLVRSYLTKQSTRHNLST